MTTITTSLITLLTLLSAATGPTFTVSPRVCQLPCSVTARIWLDDDASHRAMSIIWPDGMTFRELQQGRRSHEFTLSITSAGESEIVLQIYDTNGLHDSRSQTIQAVGEHERIAAP